ncbi:MAG: hypothetical protein ACU84Q_16095 [Gammaproteobacteria bacterium]
MSIDELAAWGEFIGGLGVIAGLVFVGIQLYISNKESRYAANESYAQSISNIGLLLASESDLAELFVRGADGLDNLDPTERLRYITFFSNGMLRMYENLYSQHRSGRLEERIWSGAEITLRYAIGSRGFKDVWSLRRNWYENKFREYIDLLVKEDTHSGELLQSYHRGAA